MKLPSTPTLIMPLVRALGVASAALVLFSGAAPVTVVPAAVTMQTLQLGIDGAPSGSRLTYTCTGPDGPVCGPVIAPTGRWTHTLTVSIGTLVWITAERPGGIEEAAVGCWISESGRRVASGEGVCMYQIPPAPIPPAPPSS